MYPARHVQRIIDNELYGEGLTKGKQLIDKVIDKECLLILMGDRGRGKTQLATWLAYERARRSGGRVGYYYKVSDLLDIIKESYGGDTAAKERARTTLNIVRNTEFLVLDEHNQLRGTEWEREKMTSLIDHRYDRMKRTIINIAETDQAKAAAQIGRCVWSRVEETGGVVAMNWNSYRENV